MSGQESRTVDRTVWERLQEARKKMKPERSGHMSIKGNRIAYSTIDDLYKTVTDALAGQGLWLNTPLKENAVHVQVVDVQTGKAEDLLAYPCVLTGQDVKKDAGTWTSCKRYAITSAFNLASGDEGGSEQLAAREEERQQRGFVSRNRFASAPESALTRIRAALVAAGVNVPNEQRATVSGLIGRQITGNLESANLTPAEVDRILDQLSKTGRP
ncbi:hypothetical protein BIBE0010001c01_00021 [Bifidobacterium phage BigBern1]|nr:hypothetical protein BIBE0010001c01_00021 [Bifidobacterium phage BigBern1]